MANLLGIDIGQNSVRGVLVKTQLRRVSLAAYIEVPIDHTIVEAAPIGGPLPEGLALPSNVAALPHGTATGTTDGTAPLPTSGAAFQQAMGPSITQQAVAQANAAAAQASHDAAEATAAEAARNTPLARAIAELLRRAGGSNIDVFASLSGDAVSLRRVELPKAAEKKLDELLPFEMESLLPFDVADTLLDYQPIELDPKQLRLLVSAAQKTRIREELARLSAAGADPVELVPAPAALAGLSQFIPTLATDGPHMVIVLGPTSTDVCMIRKGRAELARTLSIGTDEMVRRAVTSPFGGPHGGSAFGGAFGHEPVSATLDENEASHFGRELKQTLLAYRMQGGGEPESICLGGQSAAVPGLFEWLSTHLSRSVIPLAMPEIVVPTAGKTALDGPPPDLVNHLPFALAMGVVGHSLIRGKHLDFRKGEFVKKRDLSVFRDFGPILGIASAAVACAFFFSIWARWSVLDDRRQLLEDELARVSEERLGEETRSPDRARALLETGRRSSDPMPAFTAYDALVAVNGAVPEGITHDLSRLAIDLGDARSGGHIELQGTVGTVDDAERIARALGEVECFRELELGPATTTAEGRRNYRIEGDILCPGTVLEDSSRRGRRRRGSDSGSGSGSGAASGGEG
jgi:general secretion pathway protein L